MPCRSKTNRISQDEGETWHEIDRADFQRLLDDETADCWVDLSEPGSPWFVTLKTLRGLMAEAEAKGPLDWEQWPTELYGLPIIYED